MMRCWFQHQSKNFSCGKTAFSDAGLVLGLDGGEEVAEEDADEGAEGPAANDDREEEEDAAEARKGWPC